MMRKDFSKITVNTKTSSGNVTERMITGNLNAREYRTASIQILITADMKTRIEDMRRSERLIDSNNSVIVNAIAEALDNDKLQRMNSTGEQPKSERMHVKLTGTMKMKVKQRAASDPEFNSVNQFINTAIDSYLSENGY